MNNELQIKGTQNFMGIKLPNIYGGFGENKKAITDKTISEIHNVPTIEIRKSINRNIKRFKINIDYIDLKDSNQITNNSELLKSLGYSKMQLSKAEHIYLLSERGYAKLIKIMDNDLAWEIHDKLIDEYFQMKEMIKENNQFQNFYNDVLNKMEVQSTNTNSNNLYDAQQINELITTVNNLASTVNVLLSHMVENTENKLNFKNEKVTYKEELDLIPHDEIETEIINTFKTITTVQEYCKFLNSKKIIIKKLGVMVFNQVARDNGIYDDYNYPTDDYKKYFIVNYGKLFLTTKSMILMYRKIKEQVIEGYIVRR